MSPRLLLCCLAAIAVVCGVCLSEDAAGTEAAQPPQEPGPADGTEKATIAIDFPGGTIKDLAASLQQTFNVAVAVYGPLDFGVGPVKFTAQNEENAYVWLGRTAQVMRRPGYLITPKEPTGKETQPTDLNRPDRPSNKLRDESLIGPVKVDDVVLKAALDEVSGLFRVPFVYNGEPPAQTFSVDVAKCSTRELIEKLADQAGCVAKPVDVLFGMTPENLAEALKYVSDEELLEGFDKNFGMFGDLPKDARMQMFAWAFDQLQNMSPEERANAIQYAQEMFGTVFDRLSTIQGPEANAARQKIGGMIDDGLEFYKGLPAGQRGQVQPLAEYFTRMRQKF